MKLNWSLIVKVFAVLIFLSGLIWFLQGINILPGSFMTGNRQWAVNGGIAMAVGVVMFVFAARRKS